MSPLELIAVVFSIACVILSIYKNIWCWAVGIVGIIAYFILFYQYKLYADMGLQVIYFAQSIYGWWFWAYQKPEQIQLNNTQTINVLDAPLEEKKENTIRKITELEIILYLILISIFTGILTAFLQYNTDSDIPLLDAFSSILSLTANILLAKKVLENWLLWIIADCLLVGIFFYKGLYLSSGTYLLFLGLAIWGFIQWRKQYWANAV